MTKLKLALSLAPLWLAIGCGGPPAGELSGNVTYQGQPLSSGTIIFMPEAEGVPYAQAEIDPQGNYLATTDAHGKQLAPGVYRVMISAVKDMGPEAPVEPLIPMKYSSDTQSGLKVDVKEGPNTEDFNLE